MNDIQTSLLALLPSKRKTTPSGWTSFNAPCCQHRGENQDKRQRGGILIGDNGSFQYHCFNCNFKAGWSSGNLLTKNTKDLFKWLGMSPTEISRLNLYALKIKDDQPISKKVISLDLIEKPLPEMTLPLVEWFKNDLPAEVENIIVEIVRYVTQTRGMDISWYQWHWSYSPGFKDRVLIPFYHQNKIVGYTARKITEGKPKYITDAQPGYVFNLDNQIRDKKYLIVVEGQFDAISIDGCAVMHNEMNETQIARINALGKEVIIVPDRDRAGAKLLRAAIENNWSVSFPLWEDDIKDVADAVKRYGRLYTLQTILHYKESNKIKIELIKKKLENAR